MSFLSALDAEIADLIKAVEADPKIIKLRELKRVRALYAAEVPEDSADSLRMEEMLPLTSLQSSLANAAGDLVKSYELFARRAVGRKPSPERQRALAIAREFLLDRLEPVKTSDIYQHLLGKGVAIGGNDPVNNLSAMLSNSPGFRSHGRSGWTIQEIEEAYK